MCVLTLNLFLSKVELVTADLVNICW